RTLDVIVDHRVLVPRPETEQVVGFALEELGRIAPRHAEAGLVAADLGTGSGAIALSLAAEARCPVEVWATDSSPGALEVARLNLDLLARTDPGAAGRVQITEGSWFDALPERLAGGVHLVVSNPPYVSAAEWDLLDPVVRDHEPRAALVPGDTGLEAITYIIRQARHWLGVGGSLVVELASHQAPSASAAAAEGGYLPAVVRRDLAGRARALVASWPGW
ncbi:MAG: N5-glutamine methyltransferase family protein, partial [Acidimicrobiales bacterium]